MFLKSSPIDCTVMKNNWDHLKALRFPELAMREHHEVLIGSDLIYYHRSLQEIHGANRSPIARRTPLGLTAFGPVMPRSIIATNELGIHYLVTEDLDSLVKKFWELESLGISEAANKNNMFSIDEKKAVDRLQNGLKYKGKRYEAPILWENDPPEFVNNYNAVLVRTNKMEERLMKDQKIMKKYEEAMQGYEDKGYIEKILKETMNEGFYIPHFPVVKDERATTKCRIVFDCAAKYDGSSLNDQILTGPKLQNDITDVLIRFRRFAYAVMADISEMYLQIGLTPKDRKFCRFFWKGQAYEWKRMLFGRADAPFIALFVIQEHVKKYKQESSDSVQTVLSSMYVDDLADSRDTPKEVEILANDVISMFKDSSMEIRKWLSNSSEALSSIPKVLLAEDVNNILDDSLPTTKLLGMSWDVKSDELYFNCNMIADCDDQLWSKRLILKAIARIYDPLGMIEPFTIIARIIFQKVWVATSKWDEVVPNDLKREWLQWYKQVKDIGKIRISRHLGLNKNETFSLHVFCDASKQAYAAVVYVRTRKNDEISVQLVVSKTRVSPLRGLTIPKLELMGSTIAVRLAKKVAEVLEVDIKNVTFWSDSHNVLFWLKRPAKFFKPFVSNRVGEIQSVTNPDQWRYINTKINPADIPSRGEAVEDLKNNDRWWHGPEFLRLNETEWPKDEFDEKRVEEKSAEKRLEVHVNSIEVTEDLPLNPKRWSDKKRLVKRTAYVCRFINNLRLRPEQRKLTPWLQPDEWEEGMTKLIKMCQHESFPQELKDLEEKGTVNKNSSIVKLVPFVDDHGIMRSKSRLQQVLWLSEDFRFPIIMPCKHALTKLIIKDVHEKIGHSVGVNATLSELAKRFWVVKARVALKEIKRRCSQCKIETAKAARPQMAPLPSFRFSEPLRAFAVVGIDFAGPFETKAGRGKTRFKRYLCLISCLQSRAVHLEMVWSLETGSFINAFLRMTCRRGVPRQVITDNGTTFVKAEKEIRDLMLKDSENIVNSCSPEIKWNFNPPYGSHFGGTFEIMIKAAKRAIYRVLNNADVNDEELITAFCHVENLLNDRPLTAPSDDINDNLPLTPNNFLIGKLNGSKVFYDAVNRKDLHPSKRWKYLIALADGYWSRWQKEVLHLCKSRTKWATGEDNMRVDQVVIVLDPIKLSRTWQLGRVVKVYPGADQVVRVVDVKYNGRVYRRPVTKLCPLEL